MNSQNRIKLTSILLLLISTAAISSPVTDLTPKFLKFWETSKTLSPDMQVSEFRKQVVPTHLDFYEYRFERWIEKKKNPNDEMKRIFSEYPKYESKFKQVATELRQNLEAGIKTFKKTFPNFKGNAPIFILNSLNAMDGGTRIISGQMQLIFGVESMVRHHISNNSLPFFHHELFHVHHYEQGFPETGRRFYHALWSEGLATYVSEVLNPGSSIKDIMLDIPPGLVEKCGHAKEFLWKDINAKFESDKEEDYQTYFMLDGTSTKIPSRAGYNFGYLVAKDLHRQMTLEQLVSLRDPQLFEAMKESVLRLQKKTRDEG